MTMIPEKTHILDTAAGIERSQPEPHEAGYLTTLEAAAYMRRSRSWMLQRKDIPYYRGRPNLYRKEDLDNWLAEVRRYEPRGA